MGLMITDEEFVQQWGGSIVHFRDERKFLRVFDFGFNLWWKPDSASFDPQMIIHSWSKNSPHFIITAKQRIQGFIHIFDEIQVILDKNYIQPKTCNKSASCMFQTRNQWIMNRHEQTCTDTTQMKYKQMCFGNQTSVRQDLIAEGIILPNDGSAKRFVAFDIESINCTETTRLFGMSTVSGCQKVISIGYTANFGNYKDVIVRTNMDRLSGIELVNRFIQKMNELQTRHYERIPQKMKMIMLEYKEILKQKTKSVAEMSKLRKRLWYLRSLCDLKIIGFNSSRYDIPVLMHLLLEAVGHKNIKVIKKGNTIFDLRIQKLCFRDAMNYCGPMSLSRFAKIFKLPISKGMFPYEKFVSIEDIRNQIKWPDYNDFISSLPTKLQDFTSELQTILAEKPTFKILTLENLFNCFNFSNSAFTTDILKCQFFPKLTPIQKEVLSKYFTISPISFLSEKKSFEELVFNGTYTSFVDYLCFYNQLDCDLLAQAMTKFIDVFENCFNVTLLDKLSLPGISEEIMWSYYDSTCPKMFSFHSEYGYLNKNIREKLHGGPTVIFHRHAEIKNQGQYDESVYSTPNGNKYIRIVSYDFNALYGYAMKFDLPTGLPFLYTKLSDDTFEFKIAANKAGWSLSALSWLNYMSYDPRFLRKDGTFYSMQSAITGEYQINHENHRYTIDGVVETERMIYYMEFLGCRKAKQFITEHVNYLKYTFD